ncbi:unnamed protein product [Cylicostephanus goldi]|uniref:WAP domain-containing protein n=1 Tax=Cylicostephanus goldi TaxID=71465 RepID=A0A3P6QIT5_CYLGO|nr:unnamed protein product [Cylicostephanus goldi]
MAGCDPHNLCPAGYYCSQNGYEGRGICCPGAGPTVAPMSCPVLPITANPVDGSSCVVACRRATDCSHSVCCFNGCGTSCQFETGKSLTITGAPVSVTSTDTLTKPVVVSIDGRPHIQPIYKKITTSNVDAKPIDVAVNNQPVAPANVVGTRKKHPIVPDLSTSAVAVIGSSTAIGAFQKNGPISTPQKIGACPSVLLNPGCREECLSDADCAAFSKCCKASCGTKCVEPTITSPCLHRLAAFNREWPSIPPPVQCLPTGDFRETQCDFTTKQCWCVDDAGIEIIGTRTATHNELPSCKS